MRQLITILFLLIFIFTKAQATIKTIRSSYYSSSYDPFQIKKNNVQAFTRYYCYSYYDNNKVDTIIEYKKIFTKNGQESKIINYKSNGKIFSIDSFSFSADSLISNICNIKGKKKYIRSILFDFSLKELILNDKAKCDSYKSSKVEELVFYSFTSMMAPERYYNYVLKKNGALIDRAFDYDSIGNIIKMTIKNKENNKLDTVFYSYDYKKLSGKSILYMENKKYLHSTIILNDKLQLVHENIFNVEYYKLDFKLAKELEPITSIIYHYHDNGLINYIEFIETNRMLKYFYQYEYYQKD